MLEGILKMCALGQRHEGEGESVGGRLGFVFGDASLPHQPFDGGDSFEIEISHSGRTLALKAKPGSPARYTATVDGRHVFTNQRDGGDITSLYDVLASLDLPRAGYYHFQQQRLTEVSFPTSESSEIEFDGYGLASVLSDIAGASRPRWDFIREDMRKIVGSSDVRVRNARKRYAETELLRVDGEVLPRHRQREVVGRTVDLEMGPLGWIPVELLSEGTLLTLALATLIRSVNRPQVLLLDDLERGLHPTAQQEVVERIQHALWLEEDLQVICTTHSPFVVDRVPPECVFVTRVNPLVRDVGCKRLTEHPEFEKWKDAMRPGEFWSSVGEDWIFEGEAAE